MEVRSGLLAEHRRDDALAAAAAFGLTPTRIDLLLSEEATVARIATPPGDVAVKIFDLDTVDEPLARWRHEIAAHAAERGLPVPTPLRTSDGSLTATLRLGDRTALAQASAWSDGHPLGELPLTMSVLRDVGRTAARLSLALDDAPRPPAHDPHVWDLRRSSTTLSESLSLVGDAEVRILGLRALRAFHGVERNLSELPLVVVHHDLHDENLRVAGDPSHERVVGILDFGDATVGPRIADLVIPAAYASRHCTDPPQAVDAVVQGWAEVWPISSAERALVAPLAAVRLATNAAVWAARADGPRREYAELRSRGSVAAAEALLRDLT